MYERIPFLPVTPAPNAPDYVVERDHVAIALRDAGQTGDRSLALDHLAAVPCKFAGHAAAGSNLT